MPDSLRRAVHRVPLLFPLYYHLLFTPYLVLKKWMMLGGEGLTDEQKRFMEENRGKWQKFDKGLDKSQGYVLIDSLLDFPNPHLLSNAVIGKYLAKKRRSGTIFLRRHWYERRAREICRSFGAGSFIALNTFSISIRAFSDALRIYRRLRRGEELLALSYEGLPIGDLIYDTYLRKTREGTIEKVTPALFPFLYDALRIKGFYDRLFQKYPVKAVVLGGTLYTELGILARTAIRKGAGVYSRKRQPPSCLRVRYYRDLREVRQFDDRPAEALVDYVYRKHREEAVPAAERYLQRRMSAALPASGGDVPQAYGPGKAVVGRDEIVRKLKLDPGKPIAVIMSHALIDAVHSNSWLLFRDYLTWIRETLAVIVDCPETNWLFKPHPSAAAYNCRQKEEDVIATVVAGKSGHTVRLLPDDVNTKSLLGFADYLVTARGTAGLEFSCFGIPCVLAGESPYSGFGFTVEPKTGEEYFRFLRELHQVKRLNGEQITRAKVVAYIYFLLLGAEAGFLREDMPLANMPILGELDENMVWQEMMESVHKLELKTDPFLQNMEQFLDSGASHLLSRPEFYAEIVQEGGTPKKSGTGAGRRGQR